MRKHARIDPRFSGPHVLGVNGQPFHQGKTGGRGRFGEPVAMWPWTFRVDVVRSERGNATPVIHPGSKKRRQVIKVREIRWRLNAHARTHHDPGHRNRREILLHLGIRSGSHCGVGLSPEVLHNDFLHVPVGPGHRTQREDRVGSLVDGFADANEQSGSERNVQSARVLQHAKSHVGVLVG